MGIRGMYSGRIAAVVVVCALASSACATASQAADSSPAHARQHASQATTKHAATGRPGVVLVNQPVSRMCVSKTFRVGVWFQRHPHSGGSRAYRISVYNPRHQRVFFHNGQAPSAHWAFWRVPAKLAGQYHTVYSAHWHQPTVWSKYRVATRAHRC
ncbi:MAG TPA: hypothetical protein VH641_01205 [Streptosporangiaceae bacterium]